MTFGVEQHEQHRRLLVALVLSVLALVVGVDVGVDAHASTERAQVTGTRVAAHDQLAGPVVAATESIAPGQGRAATTSAADVAIGSRVAPRAAGLADDAVTTGARATGHGAERLTQAGFTDDLIAQTRAAFVRRQADGATVFAREVSPGRFDFFVEGQRGVITAHRNWSQKSIDRLARNYGWEGWPP